MTALSVLVLHLLFLCIITKAILSLKQEHFIIHYRLVAVSFVHSEPPGEDGYLVDARLDFSCESGYRLQGASSTECTSTGRWTYSFPTCQSMQLVLTIAWI